MDSQMKSLAWPQSNLSLENIFISLYDLHQPALFHLSQRPEMCCGHDRCSPVCFGCAPSLMLQACLQNLERVGNTALLIMMLLLSVAHQLGPCLN